MLGDGDNAPFHFGQCGIQRHCITEQNVTLVTISLSNTFKCGNSLYHTANSWLTPTSYSPGDQYRLPGGGASAMACWAEQPANGLCLLITLELWRQQATRYRPCLHTKKKGIKTKSQHLLAALPLETFEKAGASCQPAQCTQYSVVNMVYYFVHQRKNNGQTCLHRQLIALLRSPYSVLTEEICRRPSLLLLLLVAPQPCRPCHGGFCCDPI